MVMVMVEERVEEGSGSVAEAAKDRATEAEAAEVGCEAEANEEEGLAVARVATGGVAAKMAVEEKGVGWEVVGKVVASVALAEREGEAKGAEGTEAALAEERVAAAMAMEVMEVVAVEVAMEAAVPEGVGKAVVVRVAAEKAAAGMVEAVK